MLRRHHTILWLVLLTLLGAVLGYYRLFTGFSDWDDEGSLMMSVKQYLQGYTLYADMPSGYGPVYYFYNSAVRTLSGTAVTHNATRFGAILPLLMTCLICAWYIFQFTRSLVLASAVHISTFLLLGFFGYEPGHPQELCILLLVSFIAAGQLVSSRRWHSLGISLLGIIAAALCLVKVNIGVFMVLAAALAFLFHLPDGRLTRAATVIAAAAAISLPFILMKSRLDDFRTQAFCVVVAASIISVMLRLIALPRIESIRARDCWIAIGSFAAFFAGTLLYLETRGIGLFAILDSLVLSNLRLSVLSRVWYVPPPLARLWIQWAIVGTATALVLNRLETDEHVAHESVSWVLFPLKLLFGAATAALGFFRITLGFAPPFAWLALTPPSGEARASQSFPRTLLCSAGILQTLYAYPAAGSQREFIKIPLLLIAALCVADGASGLSFRTRLSPRTLKWAMAVLLIAVPVSYLALIHRSQQTYNALPSLALRGAERIHVEAEEARQYQWLTNNIENYCDVMFGLPNIPSLHFWTARDPVTTLIWDGWILNATAEQQNAVQSALAKHRDACIVYNPDLVAFWNRTGDLDVEALPLVRYIRSEFKTLAETNHYSLLIRNDRPLKLEGSTVSVP
jgi:hypothetical protein